MRLPHLMLLLRKPNKPSEIHSTLKVTNETKNGVIPQATPLRTFSKNMKGKVV